MSRKLCIPYESAVEIFARLESCKAIKTEEPSNGRRIVSVSPGYKEKAPEFLNEVQKIQKFFMSLGHKK